MMTNHAGDSSFLSAVLWRLQTYFAKPDDASTQVLPSTVCYCVKRSRSSKRSRRRAITSSVCECIFQKYIKTYSDNQPSASLPTCVTPSFFFFLYKCLQLFCFLSRKSIQMKHFLNRNIKNRKQGAGRLVSVGQWPGEGERLQGRPGWICNGATR